MIATILSAGNEQTIGDAVRSVLPLVDRVLLVDTGIADRTIEIAREIAGDRLIVRQFAWSNDFAAARNFCLDAVRELGGEWYLMCDSDETFVCANPAAVREQIANEPDVDCWLIANGDGTYYRERLVRVSSSARWDGRTHEALIGLDQLRKRVLRGATAGGRPKSSEAFRSKLDRDLVALQAETTERPENPRWWYYLGRTLEDLGRHADAVMAYQRCAALPGWSEQSAWACYRAAVCLAGLRDYAAALDVCEVGMQKDRRFAELAWLAGWCSYQLGRYDSAAAWARRSLEITASGACEQRIGFRYLPGWRARPEELLRWAERQAESKRIDRPSIIVLGVGHGNTTITARQLHALGWNAGDADSEYAESVSIRAINHRLLSGEAVARADQDAALSALPQPWAVKDPRFAYGTLDRWLPVLEKYRPLLLWIVKDREHVLASFARRGENAARLDQWLAYCQDQFDRWPWGKLKLDAAAIGAACELWRASR